MSKYEAVKTERADRHAEKQDEIEKLRTQQRDEL